jgi:nitrogen-specific signal transduction histidine kinase
MTTVLLITGDEHLRQRITQALPAASLFLAQDPVEALRYLERIDIDLAIWASLGRGGGQAPLQRARHIAPDCVTVAIGIDDDGDSGFDFVLGHGHTESQLDTVIRHALDKRRLTRDLAMLRRGPARTVAVASADPEPAHTATQLLREFARLLAAGFDLPRLLEAFVDAVVEFLRPARVALLLPDTDERIYRVHVQRGLAPKIAESVRLSEREGLCQWLIGEGRPAGVNDVAAVDAVRELTILQAVLAVPLLRRGELVAVLVVGPPVVRPSYAAHEVETLFDLATHMASAMRGIDLHHRLQTVSEFNEHILEDMSSGVVAIGLDERVSTMNRRAAEILQLSAEATIGQDLRVLPSPLGDMLYQALRTGHPRPATEIQLALRGLWIQVSSYPVHGARSKGAVLVFDDITAHKEMAAQKLQAEQSELLTRVVGRVADEIKNPLVSINTFMELIDERFEDSDFRHQFFSIVSRDVRRLVQVFEMLTGLVTPGDLNFGTVAVDAIVADAVATVQAGDDASPPPLEIHVTQETPSFLIKVDARQLHKALCYVMRYLAYHSSGGAVLSVTVGRETEDDRHDDVRVVIASRTASVPVRDLDKLFDPVRMVQEDLIDVGPAVSQRIVEALGGRLTLRRGPHDLAFLLRIPIAT